MIGALLSMLLLLPAAAAAAPWVFTQPLDISTQNGPGIFHHLGSGGRLGIAVSGQSTGIAWEDNRDGVPRCYVALLEPGTGATIVEHRISGSSAAFEPAIQGLGDGRFAAAWEENGEIWVRVLTAATHMGPAIRLDEAAGAHASLLWHPEKGLIAAWSRKDGPTARIWLAFIDVAQGMQAAPRIIDRRAVETAAAEGDQTYPSVAVAGDGSLVVGWEDRRQGHTTIMAAAQVNSDRFSAPVQINESSWGGKELGLGRGTGAMRVTLAGAASGKVVALWADKRNFRSGYDVFAAFSTDDGQHFGQNQKVQDGFADGVGQWHPSVSSGGPDGLIAAVWDDDRDGSSDVWLSWHDGSGWSADLDAPGAAGDGDQAEPAVVIDADGDLHLAWVEKAGPDSPTRVRYLYAQRER